MGKAIDRRTARTRKSLSDALVALILRKSYDSITVQDVIDEANVGRSTFYMHYTGKEDLLRAGFEELRAKLASAASQRSGSEDAMLPFSLTMFEHACEHKQIYRALAGGRGGVVAGRQMRLVLSDLVRQELGASGDDGVPEQIRVQFVVDTFLAVLSWSIGRKPALAPVQMNQIFRRLVLHGVGAGAPKPSRAPQVRTPRLAASNGGRK